MIIVEIIGGLGNQMFQYAFSLSLKKYYGDNNVKLYIGRFDEINDNKGYELPNIFSPIKDEVINNKDEIKHLVDESRTKFAILRRMIFGWKSTHIREYEFKYNPNVFRLPSHKDFYFRGLWQDELYFESLRDSILEKYIFPECTDIINRETLNKIKTTDSVSIHIRRGDYISNNKYKNLLGDLCNIDYYKKAIDYIEKRQKNLHYFIFSDDIKWAKSNFEFLIDKCDFINNNKGRDSYIDMQLMSNCKHNIIANSTFSWWGAWLNRNPNKIVIAPRNWFRNSPRFENNHIVPDNWIKIYN